MKSSRLRLVVVSVASGLLAAACAVPDAGPPSQRISALPAIVAPADNPGTPAKVALGAQLFVDKRLSGSGNTACQSCHYRNLGWTDALPFSKRDDGVVNARHTPTLYNVGHQTVWYWDGRAATLEGQVLAAWRGQSGADPVKVVALLNTIAGYAAQFQAVFGMPATPDAVTKALAAYLRTKNSENSPWDRFESGERSAVSADAVEGFRLFMGKGRCAACHTPPFYGNSSFFNIGLEAGKAKPDPGRFTVTRNESDTGAFKTPTLRSIAISGPYFHDGSRGTLEEAVHYMAAGGGDDPKKTPILTPTGLSDAEIRKVVEFLKTLTSSEPWEAPRLP
ncbi:MAG: cytochrome c peroxidase [Caldimonas sp.]